MHIADVDIFQIKTAFYQFTYRLRCTTNQEYFLMRRSFADDVNGFFNSKKTNAKAVGFGNDSNLLIVFYVQIMPDDFVMQLHRF